MARGGGPVQRLAGLAAAAALLAAGAARSVDPAPVEVGEDSLVQLDFQDVELAVVIETIARLTGKNFIYDDRVRGRVTIISPTRITVEQAYAVFESVLQVKGFTTVPGPGGAIKVIPTRDAKEMNIETLESRGVPPDRDRFITRLIPLQYIDAEAISNTLKPLISKDGAMVAYPPTNTIILTDASSNIRRILSILESIDVETYREELAVIHVQYADAATLAEQLAAIYETEGATGAQAIPRARAARVAARAAAQAAAAGAAKTPPRILTDPRTNSLIVMAARQILDEIRRYVARLDVPISGEGSIRVYYLKNADAEELSNTLNALLGAQPSQPAAAAGGAALTGAAARAGGAQALSAVVSELAGGVTVTADVATNSLVIQGSKEAYQTLAAVIEKLDIARPQVLVEALIMEVSVGDSQELGFDGIVRVFRNNTGYTVASLTDSTVNPTIFGQPMGGAETSPPKQPVDDLGDLIGDIAEEAANAFVGAATYNTVTIDKDDEGKITSVTGSFIQGVIRATANKAGTNILSAPHILTSDNEEAEIKIGSNIPIITSRVQSAAGQELGLATSQNIERKDIGVTLRVTPQITEGETVRLEIFQEITAIDARATAATGTPSEVGVSLSNRKIENVVVVADAETVVIGGLLGDTYSDTVDKVPWLGDIPILGWLFKRTKRTLDKVNLLVFLTPYIVRKPTDLEYQTIRKREEFRRKSAGALVDPRSPKEREGEEEQFLDEYGVPLEKTGKRNPARDRLGELSERYPLERMREIEQQDVEAAAAREAEKAEAAARPRYAIAGGVFPDEAVATQRLTELLDAGYEATLVSSPRNGGLVFELRLGPFASREQAEREAEVLQRAFGLDTSLLEEPAQP